MCKSVYYTYLHIQQNEHDGNSGIPDGIIVWLSSCPTGDLVVFVFIAGNRLKVHCCTSTAVAAVYRS